MTIIKQIPDTSMDVEVYFDGDWCKPSCGNYLCTLFILTGGYSGTLHGLNEDEYNSVVEQMERLSDSCNYGVKYGMPFKKDMENEGITYSPVKCHKLKELFYNRPGDFRIDDVARFLTIKTGNQWTTRTVRGYSQGDWCVVLYCVGYYDPDLMGEIYMGCCREFTVDDVGGYFVADREVKNDSDYKRIVCEQAGIDPASARMELITGTHTFTTYDYTVM